MPDEIVRTGERRRVLLLQGLMGPLFRHLGQGLIRAGHTVYKVNFNGGDRAFWRLPGGIDYRGTLQDWPAALEQMLRDRRITDVVLFGDCRDHHMAATRVCRALDVPVHVFEEGYIRPDWVTLELGGVNGHSSLPRDPQWYRDTAAALPPVPQHSQVPSSFRRRALEGLLYNVADVFTRWHYSNWNNHRPWPPLVEGMGWLRKLRARKLREAQAARLFARMEASPEPYFLFPLQLDSDAQIRLHSPFAGIAEALNLIIASFARHAPADTRKLCAASASLAFFADMALELRSIWARAVRGDAARDRTVEIVPSHALKCALPERSTPSSVPRPRLTLCRTTRSSSRASRRSPGRFCYSRVALCC